MAASEREIGGGGREREREGGGGGDGSLQSDGCQFVQNYPISACGWLHGRLSSYLLVRFQSIFWVLLSVFHFRDINILALVFLLSRTTLCDGRGHLANHLVQHQSHNKLYSFKLRKQVWMRLIQSVHCTHCEHFKDILTGKKLYWASSDFGVIVWRLSG